MPTVSPSTSTSSQKSGQQPGPAIADRAAQVPHLTVTQARTTTLVSGSTTSQPLKPAPPLTVARGLMDVLLKTPAFKVRKPADAYLVFGKATVELVLDPKAASKLDENVIVTLRNCMFADLSSSLPNDADRRAHAIAVSHSVDKLIAQFVRKRRATPGTQDDPPLTLAEFISLTKPIQSLVGKSADEVNQSLNAYCNQQPKLTATRELSGEQLAALLHGPATLQQQWANVVHERVGDHHKAAKAAIQQGEEALRRHPHGPLANALKQGQRAADFKASGHALMGIHCVRGLGVAFGYPTRVGDTRHPVALKTFTEDEAREHLKALVAGQVPEWYDMAALLVAIRSHAALGKDVVDCTNHLLKHYSLGSAFDHTFGVWQVAAALVLCLPPAALADVAYTPRVVEVFREEARVLLGSTHYQHELRGKHAAVDDATGFRRARALERLASEAVQVTHGKALADQLEASLRVLEDNAQHLAQVVEENQQVPKELEGKRQAEVLASVPRANTPEPASTTSTHTFLQTSDLSPMADDELSQQPHEDDDSPIDAQAVEQDEPVVTVRLPAPESKDPPFQPSRPNKTPGSKEDLPAAHYHPREHEALKKRDAKLRKLKVKLVQGGFLDPWANLTQARWEALREEIRNDRLRRNTGSEAAGGGRLINSDPLTLRAKRK